MLCREGGPRVGNYGNGTGPDLLMFHPGSGTLQCLFRAPVSSDAGCKCRCLYLCPVRGMLEQSPSDC